MSDEMKNRLEPWCILSNNNFLYPPDASLSYVHLRVVEVLFSAGNTNITGKQEHENTGASLFIIDFQVATSMNTDLNGPLPQSLYQTHSVWNNRLWLACWNPGTWALMEGWPDLPANANETPELTNSVMNWNTTLSSLIYMLWFQLTFW